MTTGYVIPPEKPRAPDSFFDAGIGLAGGPVPEFTPAVVAPPSQLVVVPRTTDQLAAAPSTADASMLVGFLFCDSADPTQMYRVSADGTQYIPIGGGKTRFVQPPNDGVTDAMPSIQSAVTAVHAAGGGTVLIGPSKTNLPFVAGSTVIGHADVDVIGCGVGVTMFTVAANFPLASVYSRVFTGGVWQVGTFPLEQRSVFYILPEAPFDPSGMVLTTAGYQRVPEYANFTILGNKQQQSAQVSGIYCPQGKSDPEWARVSGAYGPPGYPTGTINLSADAEAYTAAYVHDVELYTMSGTGFYAGPDRQRAKLGNSYNCQQSGTFSGSNVLLDARGYEILGNDAVIAPGIGCGNNTSPVQGSGQSGHLVAGGNFYPQKGPNAYLVLKNQGTNGASIANTVLNGALGSQVSQGDPNARKGIMVTGCDFNLSQVLCQGASGAIPSVPDDAHNAYVYQSGYRQGNYAGNVCSVDQNSFSFKYHASAQNLAGMMWTGIASSEANVKSYVGSSPFFTDNTGGVIGYVYVDPNTQSGAIPQLHIGVHANGVTAGPTVASTQFVVFDTPVVMSQGIVGRTDGTAPPVGFQGEPIFANGTISAITNNTLANATSLVVKAGEWDLFAEAQFVVTSTSVAAAGCWFEVSISTTSATLDTSSARTYAAQLLPIPAGGGAGTGLCSLRVGPIRANPTGNTTYYAVIRGNSISTNTISAAASLHGRRY